MSKELCISIIIPFYNAKKYINNCIKNLQNQKFKKSFEVIMINDGSTDQGVEMVKKFNDKKIRLFNLRRNSGPSTARNLGIKKSKGKYIFFFDVDDSLSHDALSKLYKEVERKKLDVVFCDKKWIEKSQNQRLNIFAYKNNKIFRRKDIKAEMFRRFNNPISNVGIFSLTGRLIRRSILTKHKIFFHKKLRYLEDETFSWSMLSVIKSIKYLKEQLYHYKVNPNVNSALSNGLIKGYPISNFKIAQTIIRNSLKKIGFSKTDVIHLGNQAFIFFIISALISFSKSIILKKIKKKNGIKIRKYFINKIIRDKKISSLIKNYKPSKLESSLIPNAMNLKSVSLLELACNLRAKEILSIRRNKIKSHY